MPKINNERIIVFENCRVVATVNGYPMPVKSHTHTVSRIMPPQIFVHGQLSLFDRPYPMIEKTIIKAEIGK